MAKTDIESTHFDLITPDGVLTHLERLDASTARGTVVIEGVSRKFVGFDIDSDRVFFNVKSVLAQIGLDARGIAYELDEIAERCVVEVKILAIGDIAREMLALLKPGMLLGKLFAADERRRVRDPFYLARMFGRSDRWGRPLLSLGGMEGSKDLILDKVDGRTVAYLNVLNGRIRYDQGISGFLQTLSKALSRDISLRETLRLHQIWEPDSLAALVPDDLLLVRTAPLHIRTVFARVIDEYLAQGYFHTSASILQPDTEASGDVYELFGEGERQLTDIPLEFYTLEPYREHVFFSDRDQLQSCIEEQSTIFKAMETAPGPDNHRAAVFVVKGEQLLNLKTSDWISGDTREQEFPGMLQGDRQAHVVERYIRQQPLYPFLKAIDDGVITSQGILLTRYFPSPLTKRMLLSDQVQRKLKGIYFERPSRSNDNFFSHEDRALLNDLSKFGLPTFWVDRETSKILQYVQKRDIEAGMFVPADQVETYLKATVFGIYGSNLLAGDFEGELRELFEGLLALRQGMHHPLFSSETPLALVTGGGPGAMEVGNRVAKEVGILSCANVVDFRQKDSSVVNEQRMNPYVEAKMSYRLDKIVERQAEFHLDFPIFLTGGIGTDFEFALEEVRRKVGAFPPAPVILMGDKEHWQAKITSRFQCNIRSGTISGSEWLSNCFYVVQSAKEALEVYRAYFNGSLGIGKGGPVYNDGFAVASDLFALSSESVPEGNL